MLHQYLLCTTFTLNVQVSLCLDWNTVLACVHSSSWNARMRAIACPTLQLHARPCNCMPDPLWRDCLVRCPGSSLGRKSSHLPSSHLARPARARCEGSGEWVPSSNTRRHQTAHITGARRTQICRLNIDLFNFQSFLILETKQKQCKSDVKDILSLNPIFRGTAK